MRAETYIHISDLVTKSTKTLEERLVELLSTDGGRDFSKNNLRFRNLKVVDIHNDNGFSGYNYWVDDVFVAQLHIATLTSGNYVIYKKAFLDEDTYESYDYYDEKGLLNYSSQSLDCPMVSYNSINMEPKSPFINHLYNIVYDEYEKAKQGYSSTARILYIEKILNSMYKSENLTISANSGNQDSAIINIEKEIYRIEDDPVLTWTERQNIFTTLKEVRSKIISVKKRVHNLNFLLFVIPIIMNDIVIKLVRIRKRPISNINGMIYKWTFGKILWFLSTVKENLGYSVALAIYGPFTFYFITQPMNPHAMWAVGKVRGAYISMSQTLDENVNTLNPLSSAIASKKDANTGEDSVSTSQSSLKKQEILMKKNLKEISWDERMSNFKAMQIAYDSNLVFGERMGRLEQMETQYNYPLTAESLWAETQRYLKAIDGTIKWNKNLNKEYISFLNSEIKRTEFIQVYIWKKMSQFFLDHPYIAVDEKEEQNQRDYYIGRAFIFMDKMTQSLSDRNLSSAPLTHKNVKKLAKFYRNSKINSGSIFKNLQKNSKLFSQKDIFDTKKLRSYMKYHWEVLFLQQNKKQEASSFSLQTYDWSIRNALWTLQSIYSAKREDLNNMAYKLNEDNTGTESTTSSPELDELLESMMHMLTVEYVSIKEEFSKNLKNDNEAALRETIINNEKSYLLERDKLYKKI